MNTFLLTLVIVGVVIAAMAIGVIFGRKPIAGSCGGLGAVGLSCDGGCAKPCPDRLARMKAEAEEARQH
ncbi:MAG: (Na+)-NQR maturation NqrM [Thauera phenolivorans]|uniref:(Na+)-NQR maturation NqrM n=1 Tax=Thauera phenolivorans TaxID=1792543 RepID=A0A7X7LV42_9RHOO|nr:(Na+)-NQR maturation NqrM [Thauera phenolivorans]NLF53873.1 (Na+)-NQR maturation NqrM [Thauera phenolivorans]